MTISMRAGLDVGPDIASRIGPLARQIGNELDLVGGSGSAPLRAHVSIPEAAPLPWGRTPEGRTVMFEFTGGFDGSKFVPTKAAERYIFAHGKTANTQLITFARTVDAAIQEAIEQSMKQPTKVGNPVMIGVARTGRGDLQLSQLWQPHFDGDAKRIGMTSWQTEGDTLALVRPGRGASPLIAAVQGENIVRFPDFDRRSYGQALTSVALIERPLA